MPILRPLSWIYLLLYAAVGGVVVGSGHLDVALALWLPFGLVALAFVAALGSPARLGRFGAAAVAGAVTAMSTLLALWAPLALWDEHGAPGAGEDVVRLSLIASLVLALSVLGAGTHLLYRELGGERRRRGLRLVLSVPSGAALACALVGAVCLALTPPGFLYGLMAIFALMWAALAAALLAAGWLAYLHLRAAPPPPAPPPPLPAARVHTS